MRCPTLAEEKEDDCQEVQTLDSFGGKQDLPEETEGLVRSSLDKMNRIQEVFVSTLPGT
jgi:hypothetical protein